MEMSTLVDFFLTYSKREIKWDKVADEYGDKKVEELKKWRKALNIDQ
jgi:hypothetical protein